MINSTNSGKRRKNLKNPRTAKTNRYYSTNDVMALYAVSYGTVQNWIRKGLRCNETGKRLFSGADLNEFHKQRREDAKRPCKAHEIYCVICKHKHSLFDEPIETVDWGGRRVAVGVRCPEGDGTTKKFIRMDDFEALSNVIKSKSSKETPD